MNNRFSVSIMVVALLVAAICGESLYKQVTTETSEQKEIRLLLAIQATNNDRFKILESERDDLKARIKKAENVAWAANTFMQVIIEAQKKKVSHAR